ncbi:MAG: SRPBCC family protein [Clostridia bacterium]|nr:SRPBCC family protein [Clostridia bacterium]
MFEKITIESTINQPSPAVWEFWNNPEHITKWNFASEDWHCPYAENDLKVGCKLLSRMEAKDGSFGFDFEGIYNEVIFLHKISYTLPDGRVVLTTFENLGNQTKVTTLFDAEKENSLELQKNGWQAILNNFKSYAETNKNPT